VTHRDDPLRPKLPSGQHRKQPNRTIANHSNRLARSGLRSNSTEPTRTKHIRGRQKTRNQIIRRQLRGCHQRSIRQRHPQPLGLGRAHAHALDASALITRLADLAGVVGCPKRPDDELARLDRLDLATDLLDNTDVLMPHRRRPIERPDTPVGPQVRPANAGRGQAKDRISWLYELRLWTVLHPNLPGAVHDSDTHNALLNRDVELG
jgi:hypothetical protein